MAIKKAKTLTADQFKELLNFVDHGKNAARDRVMVLLSFKCGLRACEIARLRWRDVTDARGKILAVSSAIELGHHITKGKKPDTKVYMHQLLYASLLTLQMAMSPRMDDYLMYTTRRNASRMMSVNALTVYLFRLYANAGLNGCSSHTGRRTFITDLSRVCNSYDNSIKDVQNLARHSDIRTTEKYIDASSRVINMAVNI